MKRNSRAQVYSLRGFSLVELLLAILVVSVLAVLLLGVFQTVGAASKGAKCAAQLRQIGVGMHLYVNENRGRLPEMSALSDPGIPSSKVLNAQELLAPYTGLPSDFSWNNNNHVTGSYGVWICPADSEPRAKTNPDLARWKGMNSYLVNYYVGKGVVNSQGAHSNTRTIVRLIEAGEQSRTWYFADGIATAGGQGRMSVGMVDAGAEQSGALQLRFRHRNKINALYLDGHVAPSQPEELVGRGEAVLNPKF